MNSFIEQIKYENIKKLINNVGKFIGNFKLVFQIIYVKKKDNFELKKDII